MSLGTKIAGKIPDSVIEFANEHPKAVTAATLTLYAVALFVFLSATDLDIRANQWRRARIGEMQRATSEALGG